MENSWILPRKEYGGFVRSTAPRRTPLPALRKRLSALQLVKKGFDKLKPQNSLRIMCRVADWAD